MCGIAGVMNMTADEPIEEGRLRQMLATIRHRGPDQFGLYVDARVGLGSARLSIVDLGTGQQPIANEDGTLWIVFNGEIFNHVELRLDLEARGHRFSTQTDTEVVLHLFEEEGHRCLERLNGQFAIAIWDATNESLFLARDRLGVRPLFYTTINGVLIFGSEVKALLADPRVLAELDPVALFDIFTFWSPRSPRTAFRGISELPAGHYMVVGRESSEPTPYWELHFSPDAGGGRRREDDYLDEFRDLLVDAARIRLRADVPVGAYLSGRGECDAMTVTTIKGSYDVSDFAASVSSEVKRLDAQVDLFWKTERDLLIKNGLTNGMSLLDCGCGPGRLLERLKAEMPALQCTGLEIDPLLVDAAQLKLEGEGCRIIQGSAEEPGLDVESFDFVTVRLVIEHVPDPLEALRSLRRLLKPHGRICIISNDFEYHLRTWPPVPQLDWLYEAYCASRREDEGDPCIARKLPLLLKQAGFNVVGFDMEASHSQILGDSAFLQAEGVGIPAQLVKAGFLDRAVFEEMVQSWKAMLRHAHHCIMRLLFVATGAVADPNEAEASIAPIGSVASVASNSDASQSRRPAEVAPDYVAPSSELDKSLAAIWGKAMGVGRVGVEATSSTSEATR